MVVKSSSCGFDRGKLERRSFKQIRILNFQILTSSNWNWKLDGSRSSLPRSTMRGRNISSSILGRAAGGAVRSEPIRGYVLIFCLCLLPVSCFFRLFFFSSFSLQLTPDLKRQPQCTSVASHQYHGNRHRRAAPCATSIDSDTRRSCSVPPMLLP